MQTCNKIPSQKQEQIKAPVYQPVGDKLHQPLSPYDAMGKNKAKGVIIRKYSAEFIGTFWLVLGGIAAGGVLYLIASGKTGFGLSAGFASNGYGTHSPGRYGMLAALICEIVMTMMFLFVIMGATDERAPQGSAPIAI